MQHFDILIIDDERKFAEMLSKRLTLRGCSCDVCLDGASGIDWVKKNPLSVSLVLLDLHLPDMYGTRVLSEIKKINADLPVVIVTGHGNEADRKECARLGANEFKNKPIGIHDILEILNPVLKEV